MIRIQTMDDVAEPSVLKFDEPEKTFVHWSPLGRYLAAGCGSAVRVWNATSLEIEAELQVPPRSWSNEFGGILFRVVTTIPIGR